MPSKANPFSHAAVFMGIPLIGLADVMNMNQRIDLNRLIGKIHH
jgi:hypothetical protein